MDCYFPARFDLSTDAVYFMRQCCGKPKYAVYPVKAGLRKEMRGKNGAIITKKSTGKDDFKLNTHGDLKLRVFGLYEGVFVCVILK